MYLSVTKIKLILLLAFGLFLSPLYSKQISAEKAQQIAENYAVFQTQLRSSEINVQLVYTSTNSGQLRNSNAQHVYYYVFNINNNGFVIISGDDVSIPVLAYSTTHIFTEENLPPNFTYWMNCLQQEIAYAIESNWIPDEETNAQWEAYLTGNTEALRSENQIIVDAFVKTQWNQLSPYNLMCPLYSGAKRSVTGCVATAMAQVMKYYEYPSAGKGSSTAYTTKEYKINMPAVDLSTGYDWRNMTNIYSSSSSQTEQNAVAKLMYHCGITTSMDYGESSGTDAFEATTALVNKFDYDRGVQIKQRDYYTDNQWRSMLINEIISKRPVLYSGTDSQMEGHAFVCDGYDDTGLFHFNWGWGGYCDGYYAMNALNPGTGGAGSGSGVYNFNHVVILGIQPNVNGTESYEMKLQSSVTSTKQSVSRGETFEMSAHFSNAGYNTFTGFYGVALTDNNDNIKEIIGVLNPEEAVSLDGGYAYTTSFPITCAVSNAISAGNYKIHPAIKPVYGSWAIISGMPNSTNELDLTVKSITVSGTNNLKVYNTPLTANPNPIKQGNSLAVSFGLVNDGTTDFIGDVDLGIYSSSGQLLQTIDLMRISLSKRTYNPTYSFYTSNVTVSPGSYKLVLYAKPTGGTRSIVGSYLQYVNNVGVTVQAGTGINDVSYNAFSIYPNPVEDMLHIQLNENEKLNIKSLQIIDLFGRQLKTMNIQQSLGQMDIPVDGLNAGVYLVVVNTDNGRYSCKFVKE